MGTPDPRTGAGPVVPQSPSWSARRVAATLPLVIAHRGASAVEPENSLAAFERANADGADGVELDVLSCATGQVVVFHDDDLTRLGGRPEQIAILSLDELRGVRLLSGAAIPTLEDALEACGDRLLMNIELKASGVSGRELRALVEGVAAAISRAGRRVEARILISSFSPRALQLWRRRAPHVPAGLLFEHQAALPLRRAWALPWLSAFSVHPEAVLCTAGAVARWHRRGYRVNVWTVDEPAPLRRFAAMGVDGVITNHPARTRATLSDQAGQEGARG
ncbi:MAG: glycerophosphodiester phosphodiesterase [Polyangia bacterium]